MFKRVHGLSILLAMGLLHVSVYAQSDSGTLVLDLKPFVSKVKLKKKVQQQLEAGGIEWGVDREQLVISFVSKKFVDFELPTFTRYGTQISLDLEPGSYRVTCIGFVPEGGLSAEKLLRKGAYFNLDILSFEIRSDEVTTLEILPIIDKQHTFFVNWFLPALVTKLVENGQVTAEIVINERTETSIPWGDYSGPLKFASAP